MVFFISVRIVISLVILCIVAITATALWLTPDKNAILNTQKMSASPSASFGFSTGEDSDLLKNGNTFESRDGMVQFRYPQSWHIQDTQLDTASEKSGKIQQSWTVQNFPFTQGKTPENSVTIQFEISEIGNNFSIDHVMDCKSKTISCENRGLNGTVYKKSVEVLNTGTVRIVMVTERKNWLLIVRGLVTAGDRQTENGRGLEGILQTLRVLK